MLIYLLILVIITVNIDKYVCQELFVDRAGIVR
jgi:hypothetical protein